MAARVLRARVGACICERRRSRPDDTVDEFCRLFPQGDRRVGGTIQEIAAIVAHASEYRDELGHPMERRRSSDVKAPQQTWYVAMAQWTQTRVVPQAGS